MVDGKGFVPEDNDFNCPPSFSIILNIGLTVPTLNKSNFIPEVYCQLFDKVLCE